MAIPAVTSTPIPKSFNKNIPYPVLLRIFPPPNLPEAPPLVNLPLFP